MPRVAQNGRRLPFFIFFTDMVAEDVAVSSGGGDGMGPFLLPLRSMIF
jgi:hypothetical protein